MRYILHSMNESKSPRWIWGALGLGLLPAALLVDEWAARWRGWTSGGDGALNLAPLAALFALAVVSLTCSRTNGRVWLSRDAGRIWLFATSSTLCLLVAESLLPLTGQFARFHRRPANAIHRYQPDPFSMPGVLGVPPSQFAQTTIEADGLRGPLFPSTGGIERVLCVGGGAVENSYLDDSQAWALKANQVASGLFAVRSAGYEEHASGHHARFLEELSPEACDTVVLMAGTNDYLRLLLGLDMGLQSPPCWRRSSLIALFRAAWNIGLDQGIVLDRTGEQFMFRRLGKEYPEREIDLDAALAGFKDRLERIVAICREKRWRLILLTQPTIWHEFLTPLGTRRLVIAREFPFPRTWSRLRSKGMRQDMDRYNAVVREVCREKQLECVDVAQPMDAVEMFFYDDYHLNQHGCAKIAELLAEYLKSHRRG